jgi:hypothetical protein
MERFENRWPRIGIFVEGNNKQFISRYLMRRVRMKPQGGGWAIDRRLFTFPGRTSIKMQQKCRDMWETQNFHRAACKCGTAGKRRVYHGRRLPHGNCPPAWFPRSLHPPVAISTRRYMINRSASRHFLIRGRRYHANVYWIFYLSSFSQNIYFRN